MCFKVFYDDASMWESGGSEGIPTRGVQAILQPHSNVGVEIVCGCDYYVLKDGRWKGVDIFGLFDFLLDSGIVLFGRTVVSPSQYDGIVKEALKEKNGWLPRERKPDG